ncbi:hypothetical protein DFA_10974 [Cavenderia fasciculata]|uniref:Monalysin Pore-forming domain-containing protein n=1 Tax=Cavenderia fasciculata TaxID=261658 RepID=F4QBX7_CACFS|nr:uncharacterized protein DFA_10974 [Cavenderia fasciculata]EGG14715.1 hypothetical protein DFA_10974 [Cavenderia fasciculata]|eukprot:XP_004351223.1 hypothetical protein DFA_10974 [Cavenderia fasciculata]
MIKTLSTYTPQEPKYCGPDHKSNRPLLEPFDLENTTVVSSELGVDNALKVISPIDQFVMIDSRFVSCPLNHPDGTIHMKPIAVLNHYIDNVTLQSPGQHTVTHFKGYYPGYSWSDAQDFQRCDDANQVKNKFNYGGVIPEKTPVRKTINLNAGTYFIFQSLIVYGIRLVYRNGQTSYLECHIYRNDVFPVQAPNVRYEVVPHLAGREYLLNRGSSRWQERSI